jgi:predicted TIM-barrel fold metal-dependent hydrolase
MAEIPYAAPFTEALDPEVHARYVPDVLAYRRSLRDLGAFLGVAPSEEALRRVRDAMGLEELTRRCFDGANMEALLLDDGFMAGKTLPLAWHARFVPVRRVLRLEVLAQDLIARSDGFDAFVEALRAALEPTADTDIVSFKSIAAYRTGLRIEVPEAGAARDAYQEIKRRHGERPGRLAAKPLVDLVVREGLAVAARRGIPVQFHTGFGDPDVDLRLANPLFLRDLLEDPQLRAAPVVLLHASYPYAREAGYLAAMYPQVFVDYGLAVPCLSVGGMRRAVAMLLELAPTSKVMYSSDAHVVPELYYVSALWGRRVLADVLEGAVADGDLTAREAEEAAEAILRGNARRVYRL